MVLFNCINDTIATKLIDILTGHEINNIEEIRIRLGQTVKIKIGNTEKELPYVATNKDIREILELASNHSMYAYGEEIKNGYITVEGGHRIGVCGRAVCDDSRLTSIKNISSVNVRVAHEIIGCSNELIRDICNEKEIKSTLLISPPGQGKTTLLRDIIRNISNTGYNVSLVDERSEIAACFTGEAQNDIGTRTDVMDACPKACGMIMMIRSMSPQVIVTDEIGKNEDIDALRYAFNCGCYVIASIHGENITDIQRKQEMKEIIENRFFQRYIVISKCNGYRRYTVYDADTNIVREVTS